MLRGLCSPLIDKSASPICSGSLDVGALRGAEALGGSRRVPRELERLRQNADLSWPDTRQYSQNIQQLDRSSSLTLSSIPCAEAPLASAVVLVSTVLLQ